MPSTPIHFRQKPSSTSSNPASISNLNPKNPLPKLLHTPLGLAIIEIQGTLNIPLPPQQTDTTSTTAEPSQNYQPIGRLVFPLLDDQEQKTGAEEGPWMKKVHLYVGENQRLVGEVRKLGKVFAVLRRREVGEDEEEGLGDGGGYRRGESEQLEIADLIRWKIIFVSRPEFV